MQFVIVFIEAFINVLAQALTLGIFVRVLLSWVPMRLPWGLGEFVFRVEADPVTGVIDMFAGPTPEELALFPTRVVPVGRDVSAFTFTMFQGPGLPDEIFEAQYASLRREFENLEREFAR